MPRTTDRTGSPRSHAECTGSRRSSRRISAPAASPSNTTRTSTPSARACRVPRAEIADAALVRGINLRVVDADTIGVSLDETTTPAIVERVLGAFGLDPVDRSDERPAPTAIPDALARSTPFLTHPVFHRYRSETEMLRYLRRLADRDLALDRTMIPLGSCTMKLNATTEMIPITWPGFARLHPFAPIDPGRRVPSPVHRSRTLAVRDHGLRRGVAATERRVAGRARRAARDPRVPPESGGAGTQRVPDPGVCARDERRERGDGGHARRRRSLR